MTDSDDPVEISKRRVRSEYGLLGTSGDLGANVREWYERGKGHKKVGQYVLNGTNARPGYYNLLKTWLLTKENAHWQPSAALQHMDQCYTHLQANIFLIEALLTSPDTVTEQQFRAVQTGRKTEEQAVNSRASRTEPQLQRKQRIEKMHAVSKETKLAADACEQPLDTLFSVYEYTYLVKQGFNPLTMKHPNRVGLVGTDNDTIKDRLPEMNATLTDPAKLQACVKDVENALDRAEQKANTMRENLTKLCNAAPRFHDRRGNRAHQFRDFAQRYVMRAIKDEIQDMKSDLVLISGEMHGLRGMAVTANQPTAMAVPTTAQGKLRLVTETNPPSPDQKKE